MDIFEIIYEKDNLMFSRKEVVIQIQKETCPKKSEVEALLGEKFSVPTDTIVVDKILPKFGSDLFLIFARIYKSKDEKEQIEPKIKIKAAKPA